MPSPQVPNGMNASVLATPAQAKVICPALATALLSWLCLFTPLVMIHRSLVCLQMLAAIQC
jgi:hypothetical protein